MLDDIFGFLIQLEQVVTQANLMEGKTISPAKDQSNKSKKRRKKKVCIKKQFLWDLV